jgi:zinc transport system substrate-binding protein
MSRRSFIPLALVGVAGLTLLVAGCPKGPAADPWASAGTKPKVLVSFAPLYSFAASVAGPDAEVKCLLTTTGPHNHGDATAQQIQLARGCDVFVINGLGLEDEADGIVPKLQKVAANPKWNVLNLGTKINPEWLREGECHHDHSKPDEDHEHGIDPHVWLSIRSAKVMVEGIRDELKRLDPAHADGYEARAAAYLKKLDRLEADGKAMLAKKEEKWILSFHESLNYFAETYGLKVAGSIEVNPGQEPSEKKLKEIIKKCTNPNAPVRVIAVEPQFPTRSSAAKVRDALRGLPGQAVEAEFAEVDPLETCDEADLSADLYEKVMNKNLTELARVLR